MNTRSQTRRKLEEGPRRVLFHEHTLDHILSFLPAEDWKAARLVCRKWNERILSSFHKKLTFRPTRKKGTVNVCDEKEKERDRAALVGVDQRMLSSISTGGLACDCRGLSVIFRHLRVSGLGGNLKVLVIAGLEEKALDCLIGAVNEGRLRSVRELSLSVNLNMGWRHAYRTMKRIAPGALPKLKQFSARPVIRGRVDERDDGSERYRSEPLSLAVQSFVTGAPNLEEVTTNVPLDLSGRNVKKLCLQQAKLGLPNQEEVIAMISAVRETLRTLCLDGYFQLPVDLQNLETLIYGRWGEVRAVNLSASPGLKRLELPFSCVIWEQLGNLLQPTNGELKLREVWLAGVPVPCSHKLVAMAEHFGLLLNSGVQELVFEFNVVTVAQLMRTLDLVLMKEVDVREKMRRKSAVLELHGVRDGLKCKCEEDSLLRDFTRILETFGGKWGIVRFVDFQFVYGRPNWTEKEVPLFGGEKMGRILISDYDDPSLDDCQDLNVSLDIKE